MDITSQETHKLSSPELGCKIPQQNSSSKFDPAIYIKDNTHHYSRDHFRNTRLVQYLRINLWFFHNNIIKEENHMSSSINASYLIEGKFFNLIRSLYNNPTTNIISIGELLKTFSLILGVRKRSYYHYFYSACILEVL